MPPSCAQCAKPLTEPAPVEGRPARFCSSSCRKAAYRRRRAGVAESIPRIADGHERRRGLASRLFVEGVS